MANLQGNIARQGRRGRHMLGQLLQDLPDAPHVQAHEAQQGCHLPCSSNMGSRLLPVSCDAPCSTVTAPLHALRLRLWSLLTSNMVRGAAGQLEACDPCLGPYPANQDSNTQAGLLNVDGPCSDVWAFMRLWHWSGASLAERRPTLCESEVLIQACLTEGHLPVQTFCKTRQQVALHNTVQE